ncbi:FT-interacting protein 3-like [Prosopis cineraria]|uniref:FT-interacting protein 3-like n=1 Tax=Prosopis cineraria TaxID=364024 RepID=UPI0024104DC6|nr:FT-interacting protein 3-like [Prosopis cineraria]XP_054784090.1 FT-interacting protein 3-like [Prosopis cineraria]XP_054784091.1 FT-interacting protein 3-like [Prosopis cineraria]
MASLKLGVEVVGAHDLLPKDGQGSCSAYVELVFDDQKFRTTIKEKDVNPYWNEKFYFNISDPSKLPSLTLEAIIYHYNKSSASKHFLGKVRLTGTSFVPYSDAVDLHYPLEKKGFIGRIKGELGLKVYVVDDPSVRSSNPLPPMEPLFNTGHSTEDQIQTPVSLTDAIKNTIPQKKTEPKRTFHKLPNSKQDPASSPGLQSSVNYAMNEMKSTQPATKVVQAFASASSPVDFALKETSPFLGGGRVVGGRVIRGNRPASTYDLVEQMRYLFVRVVKARDLPMKDVTGSLDPYVEVKVGNYKGTTKHFEKNKNPEWNEVFAFAGDNLQSSVLEVVVKDKDMVLDDLVGTIRIDLHEVPTRVPPDSPLAPEWYRIENKNGERKNGELMLAVWYGTQADEAFADAWHSDAISPGGRSSAVYSQIRSKVYHSPRLWYVRVKVIEAQDLVVPEKSRFPDAYVKAQLGNQILKTKAVQARTMNPRWEQELMFVAAEPFEEPLILSVEDRVGSNKDETIGTVVIPLTTVVRRADDRFVPSKWHHLEKSVSSAMEGVEQGKKKEKDKFFSRLHLNVYLDGGYHVLDESTYYSSDLRPTAKQLWKKSIGILELGILNIDALQPTKTRDGKGTSDTYCVAKYGQKWVRTRTIIDSLNPRYNEQYTWEVYDPATVLTVGVFDNAQINSSNGGNKDSKIGKVRVRISTLETGRVYTHTYPLLMLQPSGVKKTGELHLAIRFSCTSMMNMMHLYFKPHLPKMHYVKPLNIMEQEKLRHQAVNIVAARLSRAEPPLRKEVVEYMSDTDSHKWSMRRSKANFYRLMQVFHGLLSVGRWMWEVSRWKNPVMTVLVHILFMMLVCFPELILPTIFLYMFVIGMWKWRFRPRNPPHMNIRISQADVVMPDELDEEFDTFPTTKSSDIVRYRYDRLRSVAGRIQSVVGDIATQGERIHALLSWRDPRATAIFMILCLVVAFVLYVIPFQIMVLFAGFYFMRHPKLRHKMPSAPVNFFRRLPALTDTMM